MHLALRLANCGTFLMMGDALGDKAVMQARGFTEEGFCPDQYPAGGARWAPAC